MPESTIADLRRSLARAPRAAVLRHAIRASRWPRIGLVVVLACAGGVGLTRSHEAARDARAAWSPSETVWVSLGDLAAGSMIAPGDVEARLLPPAALPRDASYETPIGRRLRDPVGTGEVIRAGRLRDGGALASQLPDGTGSVRLFVPSPHLMPGDRVDLYALLDGARVAADAEVIAVDDGIPIVAVVTGELPAVVRSFTTGDVVPVVVG